MARIRSFGKLPNPGAAHPTEVDCEYAVVDSPGGRLLHLTTFGSDHRQSSRKSSQTLQLDRDHAKELLTIIEEAFPGIRS